MISIITRDELAHIMNGEITICICKRQVYTAQIITGSYILSTTLTFCSRKFIVHPKWNNLYEEKLQTNFFAGSST